MELKIKFYRKQRGLTVDKLSKKLNIAQSTLTQYENSNRDIGTEMLCKIADILGTSVDQLLGREYSPAVVTINQAVTPELSENKKQLIEMIQQLSEDDTVIALGIIARLNNQPINDIIKKIN